MIQCDYEKVSNTTQDGGWVNGCVNVRQWEEIIGARIQETGRTDEKQKPPLARRNMVEFSRRPWKRRNINVNFNNLITYVQQFYWGMR